MMKKTMYAIAVAVALCTTTLTAETTTAAKNATATPVTPTTTAKTSDPGPAKPAAARAIPFYGKIGTVDKASKTFTIEGKKSARTFTTTASTKMEKVGGAATWDDLKTGESVRGSALKKAEGHYEAVTVRIGQKEKKVSSTQPQSKPKNP